MKNQLEKLRAKLAQIQGRMTTMLNENPDGLDDAQSTEYDQLEIDFDATRSQMQTVEARIQKEQERQSFLGQVQRAPLAHGEPIGQNDGTPGEEGEAAYRSAFWAAQTRKPLTTTQTRALNEGVAEKGGYLLMLR